VPVVPGSIVVVVPSMVRVMVSGTAVVSLHRVRS
jgi:hypothetical protein